MMSLPSLLSASTVATATVVIFLCVCVQGSEAVHVYQPNGADKQHDEAVRQLPPPWRKNQQQRASTSNETVTNTPHAPITDLDVASFSRRVNTEPLSLVLFHASWSMSSQVFYDTFLEVAQAIHGDHAAPGLFAVDLAEGTNHQLGQQFSVRGVPQLMIFRHGNAVTDRKEKNIPHGASGIVSHLRLLARQTAKKVMSVHDAEAFVDAKTKTIASSFNATRKVAFGFIRNYDTQQQFIAIGRSLAHSPFTFVYTDNSAVFQRFGVQQDTVVIYHSATDEDAAEEEPVVLAPLLKKDEFKTQLTHWLSQHAMPLLGDFNADTKLGYLHKKAPMLLFFHGQPVRQSRHAHALRTVARLWRNVTFAIVDPSSNGQLFSYLQLQHKLSVDGFGIALMVDRTKYKYDEKEFSAEKLKQFLERVWLSKTIAPFHLSATVPDLPQPGSGKVAEINYNLFSEVVLNESTDVLVVFTSRRCAQCNELLSVAQKLGTKYAGIPDLSIVTYDVSANDAIDGYTPTAAPAVKFVTTQTKSKPIVFTGPLGFKQLDAFMTQHATVSLKRKAHNSSSTPPISSSANSKEDL